MRSRKPCRCSRRGSATSRRNGRKSRRRSFGQERLHQRQEQELAGLELQQRNFQLRIEALQSEQASLAQRRDEAEAAVARQRDPSNGSRDAFTATA